MGRPKATLPRTDGRTLVEHVVQVARQAGPWMDETVILGHCDDLPTSLSVLPVLEDAATLAGPLAGLCSLLRHARNRWSMLLACDMPLMEASVLRRLCDAIQPNHDVVAFRRSDGAIGWHACCALYHPRLLPVASEALERGSRSLQRLLSAVRLLELDPTPAEERAMANVNDRQEYERLGLPR